MILSNLKFRSSKSIKFFLIGTAVEQIRFPERSSPVGQLIDSYLKSTNNLNDQAIHLLFSSNRWEQSSSIEEKLKNGCTLVRIYML